MLGFIALMMFFKFYPNIFISIGMIIIVMQMFRSHQYIKRREKTILKSIVSSTFFILLFLSVSDFQYRNYFEKSKTINFSMPEISKREKTQWDRSFLTRLRLQLELKYMAFYTKEFKPINDYELEKYKILALNIGECFVDELQFRYPDYVKFEESLHKNSDNETLNIISSIETNCINKYKIEMKDYEESY